MSIWTDMIKYNIASKMLSLSNGVEFNISIETKANSASTSFRKFATFIPKLDGKIKTMRIKTEQIKGGDSGDVLDIEIRDYSGSVVKSYSGIPSSLITISTIPVKAFSPYEIYYKNTYDETNRFYLRVPSSIECIYNVETPKGYIDFKSEI